MNNEGFAATLLTMALSPNREEYARPFSTQEYYRLEKRVRDSRYRNVGDLLGVDISGLMMYLGVSEEDGYRIFTLLNRGVQFSYALEDFAEHDTQIVTLYDEDYPQRLRRRMPEAAPPFFYRAGNCIRALFSAENVERNIKPGFSHSVQELCSLRNVKLSVPQNLRI